MTKTHSPLNSDSKMYFSSTIVKVMSQKIKLFYSLRCMCLPGRKFIACILCSCGVVFFKREEVGVKVTSSLRDIEKFSTGSGAFVNLKLFLLGVVLLDVSGVKSLNGEKVTAFLKMKDVKEVSSCDV